jgi:hypothetical protein
MERTTEERAAISAGQRSYWRSAAGLDRRRKMRDEQRAARLERRRARAAEVTQGRTLVTEG